ncbi:hypothetical protein IGI01_11645 [Bacillus thuringiensis]|nr:hypothetical protein [Bacillus thuringiensis]
MMNMVYIFVFWVLILIPILYLIKIKNWSIKVAAVLVGRIILSIAFFLNGMDLGLRRNWIDPPYEKEWDFFIKSLQNGKTVALLHLLLLLIVVTYDSVIIIHYRNKKK